MHSIEYFTAENRRTSAGMSYMKTLHNWPRKIFNQDVSVLLNAILSNIGSHMTVIKLTHWGRVTHICAGELTIIVSDNGLSPGRRQAIIWTNAGILLIGPYGTNFSEILIEILTFSFTKMSLKVSSAKWRPFCLGLNVLNEYWLVEAPWRTYVSWNSNVLENGWSPVRHQAIILTNAALLLSGPL